MSHVLPGLIGYPIRGNLHLHWGSCLNPSFLSRRSTVRIDILTPSSHTGRYYQFDHREWIDIIRHIDQRRLFYDRNSQDLLTLQGHDSHKVSFLEQRVILKKIPQDMLTVLLLPSFGKSEKTGVSFNKRT
jgi:hypothetical protein